VVDKSWNHKIYVASEKSLLKSIIENKEILSMIKEHNFLSKFELMADMKRSQVLEPFIQRIMLYYQFLIATLASLKMEL